jgi:hypothetical protein
MLAQRAAQGAKICAHNGRFFMGLNRALRQFASCPQCSAADRATPRWCPTEPAATLAPMTSMNEIHFYLALSLAKCTAMELEGRTWPSQRSSA